MTRSHLRMFVGITTLSAMVAFACAGVTSDSNAGQSSVASDASGAPGPSVTGDGGPTSVYSPPPIDHTTPDTLDRPTTAGRIDAGRLEPVAAEAAKIDYGLHGDPQVMNMTAVQDSGLWQTLQELRLNPITIVGGTLAVTVLIVAVIVAISRAGVKDRQRRLMEAGPPVYFEGDVTFEADRDALARLEKKDDEGEEGKAGFDPNVKPGEAGPRRAESGLLY